MATKAELQAQLDTLLDINAAQALVIARLEREADMSAKLAENSDILPWDDVAPVAVLTRKAVMAAAKAQAMSSGKCVRV
jgi:hypothetical protein